MKGLGEGRGGVQTVNGVANKTKKTGEKKRRART